MCKSILKETDDAIDTVCDSRWIAIRNAFSTIKCDTCSGHIDWWLDDSTENLYAKLKDDEMELLCKEKNTFAFDCLDDIVLHVTPFVRRTIPKFLSIGVNVGACWDCEIHNYGMPTCQQCGRPTCS